MSEPLKLKQWVNNIKLQNKLVIIYVVTGLLPLIIPFCICVWTDALNTYGQGCPFNGKCIKAVGYNSGRTDRGI